MRTDRSGAFVRPLEMGDHPIETGSSWVSCMLGVGVKTVVASLMLSALVVGCGAHARIPMVAPSATTSVYEQFLAAMTATAALEPTPTPGPAPSSTAAPLPTATPTQTTVPTPSPTPTRVPLNHRVGYTATVLEDGRVLILGRWDGAEIFDPDSGRLTQLPGFERRPYAHTATLLPDGRVLIAGGVGEPSGQPPVTIFDPVSGEFINGPPTERPRYRPTAVLLAGCSVLIIGGTANDVFPNSAEVFDPSSNSWRSGGVMAHVRVEPQVVRLLDGRVMALGGGRDVAAEIFDPVTLLWNPLATPQELGPSAMTLLHDGRVLIIGADDESVAVRYHSQPVGYSQTKTAGKSGCRHHTV